VEIHTRPTEGAWLLSWCSFYVLERDIHFVKSTEVFEIVGYLLGNIDIAIGRATKGIVPSLVAFSSYTPVKCVNIYFHPVAFLDVGVIEITKSSRPTMLCELFVFSRPLWVFAFLFFVPREELMAIVFLERLDILLGGKPFFVVRILLSLFQHLRNLIVNICGVLVAEVWNVHMTDPPAVAAVIRPHLVDPEIWEPLRRTAVEIPAFVRHIVEAVDMGLDCVHLETTSLAILFICLVEHLLELLDTLIRNVIDVCDTARWDEGDLQLSQSIQGCRVWNSERLENSWWVDGGGHFLLLNLLDLDKTYACCWLFDQRIVINLIHRIIILKSNL